MPNSSSLAPLAPTLAGRPELLVVRKERGVLRLLDLGEGVMYVQTAGHLDLDLGTQLRDATLKFGARGVPIVGFIDWEAMNKYDAGARQILTDMVLANRRLFREVCVLTGSTVVSVGVSTAGLATSLVGVELTGTTSRSEFMSKLAAHQAR